MFPGKGRDASGQKNHYPKSRAIFHLAGIIKTQVGTLQLNLWSKANINIQNNSSVSSGYSHI